MAQQVRLNRYYKLDCDLHRISCLRSSTKPNTSNVLMRLLFFRVTHVSYIYNMCTHTAQTISRATRHYRLKSLKARTTCFYFPLWISSFPSAFVLRHDEPRLHTPLILTARTRTCFPGAFFFFDVRNDLRCILIYIAFVSRTSENCIMDYLFPFE